MSRPLVRRGPVIALLLAAGSFGCAMTGTKYALGGMGPLTLLALELVLATLLLWTLVAVRGFHRPRHLGRVVLLGVVEPGLAYLSETLGLTRTSATNGALISGLECVFVVLLAAVVLREHIDRAVGAAVAIAVVGLAVLERGNGSLTGPGLGDGLVLVGALSAATYTILARGLAPDDDPMSVTAVQFTSATVIALPVAVMAWTSDGEGVPLHVPVRFLIVAALVGVVGYGASFVLFNYAITVVEAAPAAIIVNLIPAVGLASAVSLLGERMSSHALIGAVLICGSVAIFAVLEWADARSSSVVAPFTTTIPLLAIEPAPSLVSSVLAAPVDGVVVMTLMLDGPGVREPARG